MTQGRSRSTAFHRVLIVDEETGTRIFQAAGVGMVELDEKAPLLQMGRVHHLLGALDQTEDEPPGH